MNETREAIALADDYEPMETVYVHQPVSDLTARQYDELERLTRPAMRVLVEAEYARRGRAVQWTGEIAAQDDDVWTAAYRALDMSALWAQVTGGPTINGWDLGVGWMDRLALRLWPNPECWTPTVEDEPDEPDPLSTRLGLWFVRVLIFGGAAALTYALVYRALRWAIG